MALDVKYLKGTRAQYDAYVEAKAIVDYYYYLITETDGSFSLYIGYELLSNHRELQAAQAELNTRIDNVVADMADLENTVSALTTKVDNLIVTGGGSGHNFYEFTDNLPELTGNHIYQANDVAVVVETKDGVEYRTAYYAKVSADISAGVEEKTATQEIEGVGIYKTVNYTAAKFSVSDDVFTVPEGTSKLDWKLVAVTHNLSGTFANGGAASMAFIIEITDASAWTYSIQPSSMGALGDLGRADYNGTVTLTFAREIPGLVWAAMSGNYSAADVYLDTAITLSGDYGSIYDTADKKYYPITTIGNKKIGDTIAAGTSVQSLFSDILSKRIQPTITAAPSASISVSGSDGTYEVGTSYTKPTATLKVKSGSYTNEGTATGVKYTAGNVTIAYGADPDTATYKTVSTTDLGNDGTISIGPAVYSADATTALFTDTSVSYTFSGKATHTDGNVAKDNLGADSNPTIQIASASPTVADQSASFRGFRKMFVGCTTEALTSSVIRGLNLKSEKASTTAFEVTAPIGATKLVIAAPTASCGKNYTLSKAEMMTMSYEDYTSKFTTESQVNVADAQSSGDKNLQAYNIYTYSFAPLQAATKFRITLK